MGIKTKKFRKKIKHFYFFLLLLISVYPIFSFQLRNISKYNYIYFDIYNFFPVLKNNSKIIDQKININFENEEKIVESQDIESANFLATLFFSPTYFEYYRKATRKGFDNFTDIKFKTGNYKLIFYEKKYIDNFFYKTKIKLKITNQLILFTKAILNTSGINAYGEYALSTNYLTTKNFKLKTNIFVFGLKKACENMIKNGIYIKYGRNFIYKISGSFIIVEQPHITINSGAIYFKIKGFIIFNNY